jgi:hypothetical protein
MAQMIITPEETAVRLAIHPLPCRAGFRRRHSRRNLLSRINPGTGVCRGRAAAKGIICGSPIAGRHLRFTCYPCLRTSAR